MLDVSVRLSCRWWWCYYSLLLLLDMSSWPRWESRWYSRCSWALTGPRGSIGNDTALSDTDYDRTAERRLTPPLASHQQRCHITPESQSDKSSATDVQVRRSLRSWCWRATDCSIRFVLSSFYLAILPRYTVVVALVVVCSVLSCPILSCPVLLFLFRSFLSSVYVEIVPAESSRFSPCHDLSPILQAFYSAFALTWFSRTRRVVSRRRGSHSATDRWLLSLLSTADSVGASKSTETLWSERAHSTEVTDHICCRFAGSSVNYSARPASLPLPASMLPRFLTLTYQQPASLLESAEPTSLVYSSSLLYPLLNRFPSPFLLPFPLLASHSLARLLSPSFSHRRFLASTYYLPIPFFVQFFVSRSPSNEWF